MDNKEIKELKDLINKLKQIHEKNKEIEISLNSLHLGYLAEIGSVNISLLINMIELKLCELRMQEIICPTQLTKNS